MKCEIHNIEMKWEGSLVKGKMQCPSCAESNITKGLQDYEECVMQSVQKNPVKEAIDWAKIRVQATMDGLNGLWTHKVTSFPCPYCGHSVATGDEYGHFAAGTPCTLQWNKDKEDGA